MLVKGGDKGRKGKRNQVEGKAHLFDMPSPHPSQNPSERGRQGRKKGKTMSAYKTFQHISRSKSLMSDWILNGNAVSNDSGAII